MAPITVPSSTFSGVTWNWFVVCSIHSASRVSASSSRGSVVEDEDGADDVRLDLEGVVGDEPHTSRTTGWVPSSRRVTSAAVDPAPSWYDAT